MGCELEIALATVELMAPKPRRATFSFGLGSESEVGFVESEEKARVVW